MQHKEIERSHVMENSVAMAGHNGLPRHHRKVVHKARFVTPLVTQAKDGHWMGHWKGGHRKNPHRK